MVNLQPFFSLQDVMKLALKVEKQDKARGAISVKYGVRSEITKRVGSKTPTTTTPKKTPKSLTKSKGKQLQTTMPNSYMRYFKC